MPAFECALRTFEEAAEFCNTHARCTAIIFERNSQFCAQAGLGCYHPRAGPISASDTFASARNVAYGKVCGEGPGGTACKTDADCLTRSCLGGLSPPTETPSSWILRELGGFSLPTENPERTVIPFMIEAGVTLDTGGATLDAYGNAGMPQFIRPGSEGDVVFTKHWQVLIGARVHIGFAS